MRPRSHRFSQAHRPRVPGKRGVNARRLRIEPLEDRRLLSVDLVSTGDPSVCPIGNGDSYSPSISTDGRYVAFASDADNLVRGDTNAQRDVFVRDLTTGNTTRVSTDSAGNQSSRRSDNPSISDDARYVAFESFADNLVAGVANGNLNIFVKDLATGITTCASTDSAGSQANNHSADPSISADGRYVAFRSSASNLVSGDNNDKYDIFVKDLTTGITTRVSTDSAGNEGNGDSGAPMYYEHAGPSISADGHLVAFASEADNLVSGDTNGSWDVFVKDLTTGLTTLASANSAGDQGNRGSSGPSISADGRLVAFASASGNLVNRLLVGSPNVYVKDLLTGDVTLASTDSDGNDFYLCGGADARISADGRSVAFEIFVPGFYVYPQEPWSDVFVKDLTTGITTHINTDSASIDRSEHAFHPSISGDGRYVAFDTRDNALAAGDTNLARDILVKDRVTAAVNLVSRRDARSPFSSGDGGSQGASISGDGRYVAFSSRADNLVPDDTNGNYDPFVKDMTTGTITRISNPRASYDTPRMSADGRYVVYSGRDDQVGDDTGRRYNDIFVRELATATVTIASTDSAGMASDGHSGCPSISADGRYVAFESYADNLVSGDTNNASDVFVKDLSTGIVTRVSTDSAGHEGNAASNSASISADGRYVAFISDADNLVSDDTNGQIDIFVKDLSTGITTRASTVGTQSYQGFVFPQSLSISADGRYVAFYSYADNLVSGDTNGRTDIFIKDLWTGITTRASTDSAGHEGNLDSYDPSISADGRYVAFMSGASNLVSGDTNSASDVFMKDLKTGKTMLISKGDPGTAGDGESLWPSISADGRYVAFNSSADNLYPLDPTRSGNVFRWEAPPPTASVAAPNVSNSGGTSYVFTVTYEDDDAIQVSTLDNSDIVVTGPQGFSQRAVFDHVDVAEDGAPRTATYRITPPGGMWSSAADGTYTVSLQADQVKNALGLAAPAGVLGTFVVHAAPDTTLPTASLTAPNVTAGGGTAYSFTVTYSDNVEVKASTLDSLDVLVTGPKGYKRPATLVSVNGNANGASRTATYRIVPPGGAWKLADNGVYTVSMQAKQVTDTSGNPVATGRLGTFTVDTAPPKASLSAAKVAKGGAASYTFTVTYKDNLAVNVASLDDSDLQVTGPNGYKQSAVLVSVNHKTSGSPRTATYRITPPGGSWDPADNGTYTVSMQTGQVTDAGGNPVAAGPLGTFSVAVRDTVPPTALLTALNVTAGGAAPYTFTVTYTDNVAVKVSTLGNADVLVTGPNGYRQLAALVSVDNHTDGSPRTATYRITPPGGSWDLADNGSYSLWMQSKQVKDTSGNSVPAGKLATFTVAVPKANGSNGLCADSVFRAFGAGGDDSLLGEVPSRLDGPSSLQGCDSGAAIFFAQAASKTRIEFPHTR